MRRLLVANRGEIAVRIINGARALGIETVAVYSDADARAPHVRLADRGVRIGPTPASESYLNIETVLAAARESDADAVHPGYGFLSENPDFADAVEAAGLTFVGPSAAAMRALGDKQRAKQAATNAGVATVPTWPIDAVPADAYPVLVKASAGGGGRGMRIVRDASALPAALDSARREAASGFGDDTLLIERLVEDARHVEVQLLADAHGTCLYVGDRDCSLQRRHQKVIEESPAPGLDAALHLQIGEAATRIAQVAGYVNAGTAEFLIDRTGTFYFLELNARLQVEHPVTELAFGIDLVEWQLRIARGERLTLQQRDIRAIGHSIEARLYAEDPVTFLPTGGRILKLHLPSGPGIRVDHAVEAGMDVSIAYDPLLAKVIAVANTREDARRGLLGALRATTLLGTTTNQALLQHALELPAFVQDEHSIDSLESNGLDASAVEPPPQLVHAARRSLEQRTPDDPFFLLGEWRGTPGTAAAAPGLDRLEIATRGEELWLGLDGIAWQVSRGHVMRSMDAHDAGHEGNHATLTAPMPGTVIATAETGAHVAAGEPVVVLEAMKMENALAAPFDGVVESLGCSVGDLVGKGDELANVTRIGNRQETTA